MRYLKLSENQNKGNDIAVNEYGERIAPKPEKSENTARNNASANYSSYIIIPFFQRHMQQIHWIKLQSRT